jgi:hypothetical protein
MSTAYSWSFSSVRVRPSDQGWIAGSRDLIRSLDKPGGREGVWIALQMAFALHTFKRPSRRSIADRNRPGQLRLQVIWAALPQGAPCSIAG